MANYVRQPRLQILGEALMTAADELTTAKIRIHEAKTAEEREAAKTIAEDRRLKLMEAQQLLAETKSERDDPEKKAEQAISDQEAVLGKIDAEIKGGMSKAEAYQRWGVSYTAPETTEDPLAERKAARRQAKAEANAQYPNPQTPEEQALKQEYEDEQYWTWLGKQPEDESKPQDEITESTENNKAIAALQMVGEWDPTDQEAYEKDPVTNDPHKKIGEIKASGDEGRIQKWTNIAQATGCLLYTSPSPRDS